MVNVTLTKQKTRDFLGLGGKNAQQFILFTRIYGKPCVAPFASGAALIQCEYFALKISPIGKNVARPVDSQQPCILQDGGEKQPLYVRQFYPCFSVFFCFDISFRALPNKPYKLAA